MDDILAFLKDTFVVKLLIALTGAVLSLRWVKGTFFERALMVTGGVALSLLGSSAVAMFLHIPEGLTGLLLGLFGMTVVNKLYEGVQSIDAKEAVQALIDRIRGRG